MAIVAFFFGFILSLREFWTSLPLLDLTDLFSALEVLVHALKLHVAVSSVQCTYTLLGQNSDALQNYVIIRAILSFSRSRKEVLKGLK